MKIHNLESYTGVELASFGETQAAIRHRLSNLPRIVVGENDSVSHDYYPDLGMHVHYEAGVCVFLEFGPPAYPLYQGVQLLYRPFSDVLRELLKLDEAPELNRSGL